MRVFVRVRDKFAMVELFEGTAEILPGDLVFFHQEIFNGLLCLTRFLPGAVQVLFFDEVVADQVIEPGFTPSGKPLLIEKGNREDVCDLLEKSTFLLGEFAGPILFVEDLNHPHEGLVVKDRGGQDLPRPDPDFLSQLMSKVSSLSMRLHLGGIIGIGDIDDLAGLAA